MVLVKTKRL